MFAESVTTTWFDYCSDLIICKFALHGPKLSLAVCHWQSQLRPNWKPLFRTSYVILCIKVSDNCTLGAKSNNFCFSVFSIVQFIWGEKTACFCGVFLDNSNKVVYLKKSAAKSECLVRNSEVYLQWRILYKKFPL